MTKRTSTCLAIIIHLRSNCQNVEQQGHQALTYLNGTPRTPWAQMALFRRVSILTSWNMDDFMGRLSVCTSQTLVPICFSANFLISCKEMCTLKLMIHHSYIKKTFMAQGALYLKPIPWRRLCMLMVYSRVTTSPMVEAFFSLRGIFASEIVFNIYNQTH